MSEYLGFEEARLNSDEINAIFSEGNCDSFGCIQNEYLIAKDENDNYLGLFKYDRGKFKRVVQKTINSKFLGKIKARNIQQQMAIDLLSNNYITIKIIAGRFGTGEQIFAHSYSNVCL